MDTSTASAIHDSAKRAAEIGLVLYGRLSEVHPDPDALRLVRLAHQEAARSARTLGGLLSPGPVTACDILLNQALALLIQSSDPVHRQQAAAILQAGAGTPFAWDALQRLAKDPVPEVAASACEATWML